MERQQNAPKEPGVREIIVDGSALELTSVDAVRAFAEIVAGLTRAGHRVLLRGGPTWLETLASYLYLEPDRGHDGLVRLLSPGDPSTDTTFIDHLVRRIYRATFGLAAVQSLLDPGDARVRIDAALSELDGVVRELQSSAYRLMRGGSAVDRSYASRANPS